MILLHLRYICLCPEIWVIICVICEMWLTVTYVTSISIILLFNLVNNTVIYIVVKIPWLAVLLDKQMVPVICIGKWSTLQTVCS
jgi:hypothetical protein